MAAHRHETGNSAVAVVEDVWGDAFDQLASRRPVRRAPEAGAGAEGSTLNQAVVGASALELRRKAVDEGMVTLRGSGLQKVKDGVTTVDEVVRETMR